MLLRLNRVAPVSVFTWMGNVYGCDPHLFESYYSGASKFPERCAPQGTAKGLTKNMAILVLLCAGTAAAYLFGLISIRNLREIGPAVCIAGPNFHHFAATARLFFPASTLPGQSRLGVADILKIKVPPDTISACVSQKRSSGFPLSVADWIYGA